MVKAIEVERVTKYFGKRQVLGDVSFFVEQEDIFGYLGPNGSGKTTTIRVILNLLAPTSGHVSILGHDVFREATKAKLKIGFVLEADGLYENMTALENLTYYGRIYGMSNSQSRSRELLALMGLDSRIDDKVSTYSKGMRHRLALARAMVHDPEILILDEPTVGVDPIGQREVRSLVLDLAHRLGKTIFFSSHNLDEVQRICNRVALIHRGEIKLSGDLETLRAEKGLSKVVIDTAEEKGLLDAIAQELRVLDWVEACDRDSRSLAVQLGSDSTVHEVVNLLCQRGIRIEGVTKVQVTLEEIYASMVKDK